MGAVQEVELVQVSRWCSVCGAESPFSTFDCADHGRDCPELVCATCGLGIERPVPASERPADGAAA